MECLLPWGVGGWGGLSSYGQSEPTATSVQWGMYCVTIGNTFPLGFSFSNSHDDGFAQFLFLQLHTNDPLALAYVQTIFMHLT
jgi:hypothetical protein